MAPTKMYTVRHAMAKNGDHTVCNTSTSLFQFVDYFKQQHSVGNANVISKDLDPFPDIYMMHSDEKSYTH